MSIYKSYRKMCPDFIVNEFVTNVIKNVPFREGYNTIRVTPKNENAEKTMYCQLTELTVVCRKGCLVNLVDVVVKSGPKNQKLRSSVPVNALFAREAYFLNTVLVELVQFQDELNLPNEDRFFGAPRLLAAQVSDQSEAIILQNKGAWNEPKFEKWVGELTEEQVIAVLKEFARFHALNFAFAKKKPDVYQNFKNELKDGFLSTLANQHTFEIIKNNLMQVKKLFTENALREKLDKLSDQVEVILESSLNSTDGVQILIHGDPTNCFLFGSEKKIEDSCNIPRAKLTNWQLVRFGSPIFDLSLFLFTNCSTDDLPQIQKYLDQYHEYLASFFKKFSSGCIHDTFSLKHFEEEWKKHAVCGMFLASLTLKIFSLNPNQIPDVNDDELTNEEFLQSFIEDGNCNEFTTRMKGLIKYCVDQNLV